VQFNVTLGRTLRLHEGGPGATEVLQVLVQPFNLSVTVSVIVTRKPGVPQLPELKKIDCPVEEPTTAHPVAPKFALTDHEKL
jgi:hypothetical protein